MGSKEELLDKIEEIGTIKRKLSSRDRAFTSEYGLYVQSGQLPSGAMQYMAGGKFLTKLIFVREIDGTRTVKKYHPGNWEANVEVTLYVCTALERIRKEQAKWSPEKVMAYEAKEKSHYPSINKINNCLHEHSTQLKKVWELIDAEQKKHHITLFFNELEQEWPVEYFETKIEEVYKAVSEQLAQSLMSAYLVGYMIGKGWISKERGGENDLYLGDRLAILIRSVFKGAQSKGLAFAMAFTRITAEGTLSALNTDKPTKPTSEPLKYDILNEILRKEGAHLIDKSIKHPELLGRPTSSININPFNPSDHEYLTQAFLVAPSHMGHFNTEKLEGIFKKLLQDDYDEYYEAAKKRITDSH
jgi:uncharacterized protein YukE